MLTEKPRGRGLMRFFAGLWGVMNGLRKLVLNLLFLSLLVLAAVAWWGSRAGGVKARTVLVLDLNGALVEQRSGDARLAVLQGVQGGGTAQIRLRDIILALDHAAKDRDINSVLLTTDGLSGGGLPLQREIASAITRFRATGKKVVAWGMNYDQRAYFLAAHADEVYLHPMGAVYLDGYGRRRNYYRDALDRLGISVNVVRAGRYKNALETFTANAPSPETQEADAELYKGLWDQYVEGVEKARRLPAGHLRTLIDGLPDTLIAADGDPARLALDQKLVDGLMTPDALRTMLIDRAARDERTKSFRRVELDAYLRLIKPAKEGDAVGVVVAEGAIFDGEPTAAQLATAQKATRPTSVRLFSSSSFNSKNKQLARFIKLEYQENLLPDALVPMNVRIMSPEDRTGRGGDHIPFREKGYPAMRFTAANEHGDASNDPGYTDRQNH